MVGEGQLQINLKITTGKKLDNYNLDPTLNWKKAEITEINENYLVLKSEKNSNIKIYKSKVGYQK